LFSLQAKQKLALVNVPYSWASGGFSREGPIVDFPRVAKKIFAGGAKSS